MRPFASRSDCDCKRRSRRRREKQITVISPLQAQIPVPITGTPLATSPTTVGYEFELLPDNLVYRGFCQKCRSEWKVGEDVRFRHSSGNIYLQPRNAKELKLDFLLQGKREADGTLTVIRRTNSLKDSVQNCRSSRTRSTSSVQAPLKSTLSTNSSLSHRARRSFSRLRRQHAYA